MRELKKLGARWSYLRALEGLTSVRHATRPAGYDCAVALQMAEVASHARYRSRRIGMSNPTLVFYADDFWQLVVLQSPSIVPAGPLCRISPAS